MRAAPLSGQVITAMYRKQGRQRLPHLGDVAGGLAQRSNRTLHVSTDPRTRLALLSPNQAGHQRHCLLGLQLLRNQTKEQIMELGLTATAKRT